MHLFYYPLIEGNFFTLDRSESAHCVRVLRLGKKDIIYLTDGKGKLFKAKIINPDKNACVTEITETSLIPPERDFLLEIAISPTRNIERFEWFLEKSTEIGIDRIIPLLSNNSERRIIKGERLKKVMVSAMKQSLKAWLPELTSFSSFGELLERPFNGNRFIATGDAHPIDHHLGRMYKKGSGVLILVGPEGDFQAEEMLMARQHGYIPVSLGAGRLRTETAGLVACHTVNLLNSL
jgi:16S rRNA (uracil1498-N3)-methyltransferase